MRRASREALDFFIFMMSKQKKSRKVEKAKKKRKKFVMFRCQGEIQVQKVFVLIMRACHEGKSLLCTQNFFFFHLLPHHLMAAWHKKGFTTFILLSAIKRELDLFF